MLIAKNLRRLRLDKGLTQEELAERLGVTGQAVSKWEREECYPDITLLPGLANCFDVTIDELIGMTEIKGKLWGVYAKANSLEKERKYHEAATVYEEALKVFPGDMGLMVTRAKALAMAGEEFETAIKLYEKRLDDNLSDHSRSGAVTALCFLYQSAGMPEKAETLARRRPHARDSREFLLPGFLAPDERATYLKEHLPGMLTAICEHIDGKILGLEEGLRQTTLGKYSNPILPEDAARKIIDFFAEN